LLFWQGSWQLLYHPASAITRTPASVGLAYDSVSFATTNTGEAQLQGWWIASPNARFTVLYLHDERGNLSDTVDLLNNLHASGLSVLAFDYRGYGQSHFEHPSEAHWKQDAEQALNYLTGTRHIDPHSIALIGSGLAANLALEVAAGHTELAAVVLSNPVYEPVNTIFNDPRAHLLPAHLLVSDRYDLKASASNLRIPSLWLVKGETDSPGIRSAYELVTSQKELDTVPADTTEQQFIVNWLNSTPSH
jgi:Lysophospholipase